MVHRRQCRTNRNAVVPIHKMICELESQGVVSKTHSPFNSPIWPVRNSDGEWRLTVDYRALNEVTPPLSAAVPDMLELQYELESKAAKWGKPVWAADEWKDIATRVEKLPVKVRHVDAHIPKSQANEKHQNNKQTTLKALGGRTFKNWEVNLAKATWMVNTLGSIHRACPAQSEYLHTVDGDKVPVVHMKVRVYFTYFTVTSHNDDTISAYILQPQNYNDMGILASIFFRILGTQASPMYSMYFGKL
ncbi:hypothetical protein DUI87_00531 [Hirundo rustica rustica]|uniref:Uncharacterized protein n=1 Tax=Hirundo rustica rustica TaxID=333673 RepID=A0A3M0LH01_HIRRU|nr:hypothetical protein DUI87_00531 [Hirundo rustica rustica]